MSELFWIIIAMGAVTYLPRLMPLVLIDAERIPSWLASILKNVPYAALGALIFPGVFLIRPDDWIFGFIGALTAFFAAFLGVSLIFVVISAIAVLSLYT